MAKRIVKMIPCLHTYRTNTKSAENAAAALQRITEAEEVTFCQKDQPDFHSSRELKEIRCPRCGAPVDRQWWKEKMEEMYKADHFFILEQEMPCCGKTVSFNQLRYDGQCGFANLAFSIVEPRAEVGKEATDALSERFGLLFRTVETEE